MKGQLTGLESGGVTTHYIYQCIIDLSEVCEGYVLHVSVILSTGGGPGQDPVGRLRVWPGGCPDPGTGGGCPSPGLGGVYPSRRLLLRMVCILLECILVSILNFVDRSITSELLLIEICRIYKIF